MEKQILILAAILIPILSYSQIDKKGFIENIEWINENPSTPENKEFVSKSAQLIKFQFSNYRDFRINVKGTKEIEEQWKGHKYQRYFQIVYSFNQLHYKLLNNNFNRLDACYYSLNKMIDSYSMVINNEPELKIKMLEKYKDMNNKNLKKRIEKYVDN